MCPEGHRLKAPQTKGKATGCPWQGRQINLLARDSVCFYPVEKTHRREVEALTDHATIIGSLHRRVVDCRRQDATCKLQRAGYRSVLKNLAISEDNYEASLLV